jgi:hypothetical protein
MGKEKIGRSLIRWKPVMSINDDINRLESELENSKEDLRENFSQISEKIEQTRSELDPAAFLQKMALPLCTVAAVVGFVLGYRKRADL